MITKDRQTHAHIHTQASVEGWWGDNKSRNLAPEERRRSEGGWVGGEVK